MTLKLAYNKDLIGLEARNIEIERSNFYIWFGKISSKLWKKN